MLHKRTSHLRWTLVFIAITPFTPLTGKTQQSTNERSETEQQILKALDQSTTIEFIETPLSDVAEYLQALHRINIQFDDMALSAARISKQAPTTLSIKGVSLRSALALLLRELKLTAILENEVLFITTEKVGKAADKKHQVLYDKPQTKAQARIQKALAEQTSMEFIDTPLQDVVEYLRELHGVQVLLDKRALKDAGIKTDLSVTTNLRGVSLRSALSIILHPLDLAFVNRYETLFITTHKEAGPFRPRGVPMGDEPQPTPAEKRIYDALDTKTTVEFIDTPLPDVAEFLADVHGIPVIIDSKKLKAAGVAAGTPIRMDVKDVSLRSILKLMLTMLDLTHVVRHEVLLITTKNDRFEPGDIVKVKADEAEVVRNGETIATLTKGAHLEVIKINEGFLACFVVADGKRKGGWVKADDVELNIPAGRR